MKRQFTHVDCFSGPGGICTGLHAAGFNTLVAIEYIKSCVDTYSANHPEVHVIHSDIRKVSAEQILPFVPDTGVDLVTSGMPCETFSTAGNSSRAAYDDRQFLFREGIRIAKIVNAKMILFENVPAITTKRATKNPWFFELLYANIVEIICFALPRVSNQVSAIRARWDVFMVLSPLPFLCY